MYLSLQRLAEEGFEEICVEFVWQKEVRAEHPSVRSVPSTFEMWVDQTLYLY